MRTRKLKVDKAAIDRLLVALHEEARDWDPYESGLPLSGGLYTERMRWDVVEFLRELGFEVELVGEGFLEKRL